MNSVVQNRCEDYPDLVQYNFVSVEIIDTKWEEEINHTDFRVSSVDDDEDQKP